MTVVLLSALVLTNLLMSTRRIQIQEGFTEGLEEVNTVGELKPGKAAKMEAGPADAASPADEDAEQEGDAEPTLAEAPDRPAKIPAKIPAETLEGLSPGAVRDGFQGAKGQDIVKQQKLIKENLESIKPMLKTAKEMLGTLNDAKDMISQFGGLSDMLPGM
jgi:hypothetical protein